MKNALSKTPFLYFLISLITGILLQYFLKIQILSIAFFSLGVIAMFFSYLIPEDKQFRWRWLFGLGVFLFLVGVGVEATSFRKQRSEFTFSNDKCIYRGVITDVPQEKTKTSAYRVYLPKEDKYVVCYFARDSFSNKLLPGEEFLFYGQIQPFKNMETSNCFDYVRYMHNQGFSGSVYVPSKFCKATGTVFPSIKYTALRYRQEIMEFYQSLGFNDTEYSILSALTLGYKNDLTDELKQGFRTTGTVHVLSVSGLHVGIIYLMISFLLGFVRRGTKYYWVKPLLIVVLLWIYAFITGLSSSVVRASAMLTVFCVADILGRKSFSVHALYITGFFMLLTNPFLLFDIGFQLSFMSVLSILYLYPIVTTLCVIKNKYKEKLWQAFAISLLAQLATFPLCLYYFGTFPTYFFVANLLIVPLVSLITYTVGGIALAKGLSLLFPVLSFYFYYLPVNVLQLLVKIMTSIIHLFENMPFALIDNAKISFIDLLLIFTILACFLWFFLYKRSKALILGLFAILILFVTHIYSNLANKSEAITEYNSGQCIETSEKAKILQI